MGKYSNMMKKVVIDDNDILEIKFLDKKINRTIAIVFGGLILIVVIASALSSWSYDVSKDVSNQDDTECELFSLIGDGVCDDIVNNLKCNFDNGDCCKNNLIKS